MTIRLWIFALFALLLFAPSAAQAINEGHYPATFMDINCTDTEDTPAAAGAVGARPAAQTSGSADGFCDHDSRIKNAPITVDTTFGPFVMPSGSIGILIHVDADVVSNDTDTWRLRIGIKKPHDGAVFFYANTGSQSTEGTKVLGFVDAAQGSSGGTDVNISMHPVFYIQLDLTTATSWDGSISWRAF